MTIRYHASNAPHVGGASIIGRTPPVSELVAGAARYGRVVTDAIRRFRFWRRGIDDADLELA